MIQVIDTLPIHIRMMSEDMGTSNKLIWRSYKKSIICKTAFFNGNIAAIWGLSGELFGNVGYPWLVLSPELTGQPMKLAFAYNKEMQHFQRMYPILEDYVDMGETETIKMLEVMGFKFDRETIDYGAVKFVRAWRQ